MECGPPLRFVSSCLLFSPLGSAMKGAGQAERFSAAHLRRTSRLLCCCLQPLFPPRLAVGGHLCFNYHNSGHVPGSAVFVKIIITIIFNGKSSLAF